jgi:hypothetical protein
VEHSCSTQTRNRTAADESWGFFLRAGECKKGKLLIKLQRSKNLLEWRDDGN